MCTRDSVSWPRLEPLGLRCASGRSQPKVGAQIAKEQ